MAEVAALLVEDVKLDSPIPYLDVGFREHRRVKNQSSARRVPLVGDALEAAKEAVKAAGEGPYLFVQYAGVVKTKGGKGKGKKAATHASNALMKHVRKVTSSRKITVHSLRHTMEDRLIRQESRSSTAILSSVTPKWNERAVRWPGCATRSSAQGCEGGASGLRRPSHSRAASDPVGVSALALPSE